MKKNTKFIFAFTIITFLTIFSYSPNVYATNYIPSENYQYSNYDYVIDKYDINIIVNENNSFDVTETIDAYFNVPKHGIFRIIPRKNTITRLDGTSSTNRARIKNININSEYTKSIVNGDYELKVGSSDKTLTGKNTYIIKYTYSLGKDPVKDYDELYYNIIGNQWDTVIGNITFNITMPKDFDTNKLGFSSGVSGSTDNSKIRYTISGNTITGSYEGILNAYEALTVRCELDEGYFTYTGIDNNPIEYFIYFIPLLFLIISIALWYKFGKDDQVIETVEFYPPDGFNSLEVGFLYKGKAENQDVTSLLIYLANKGYIKISESEEKALFLKSKSFKVIKLKDYDGNNVNERLFLNNLFKQGKVVNGITEVSSNELYDDFYITTTKILSNMNSKENKNTIFEKTTAKRVMVILMIIASYCLITIPPMLECGDTELLWVGLLFPGIGFTVLFSLVFGEPQTVYVNGVANNSAIASKIFGLIWGLGFGGFPWWFIVLPTLLESNLYLFGYIFGLVCILGMVLCFTYLPKRTKYGNQVLGKIKGFRNFLIIAEKERLEAMVLEHPTYFYDILPYTYVLGVSDKWIKKFEAISLAAPSWYDSPSDFSIDTFDSFVNSTMSSAQSVMSSNSTSSSDSGGGSSCGGSGGGGGGSW